MGITPDKYSTQEQVLSLLERLEKLSRTQKQKWVKCFMLSELLLKTGIRISECQAIKHKDIELNGSEPKLFIKNGKGNKSRFIPLGDEVLRQHIEEYILWKKTILQGVEPDDYFLQSKCQDKYSVPGLQQLFKMGLRHVGLERFSCHSCRHTLAVFHYQKNLDLRSLQIILGHASPQTTCVYADRPFKALVQSTKNLY